MKKKFVTLLSVVCLIAMLVSMAGVSHAQTAELTSTQNFLSFLDKKGIEYSYYGLNDEYEQLYVSYDADNFEDLECSFFFRDDCEEVSLRVWNIVYASAGKNDILSALNTLNDDYKFAKFVLDESDNTVQAELDMYIDGEHCGRSVYDAMMALFHIVDSDDTAEMLHALE